MEAPLPWERLLWRDRPWGSDEYVLTDIRLVRIAGERSDEIALQDIGEVEQVQSVLDRLTGRSTVIAHSRRGHAPLVVGHIHRGAPLSALLDLLARDPHAVLDERAVEAAMSWEPLAPRRGYGKVVAVAAILAVAVSAMIFAGHGKAASVLYAPDDAIYPQGHKRDRAAIVAFMERDVLPWARQALGPIVGGADRVGCETCHGPNAEVRGWRMPAVTALPEPDLAARGWETYSASMNAQMRNAVYGYLAESGNQARAAHMREVVMPGMARLLRRPAYDFTTTYEVNRAQNAFGCYHCHLVGE